MHMPKTGGSFVTQILRLVYGEEGVATINHKHATCNEIPAEHRHKPILSVFRSPFERYISQYHYAWWKTHPEQYCDLAAVQKEYPHYPDVSFAEFVHIANRYFVNCFRGQPSGFVNQRLSADEAMGWHSEQFIRFFCHQPQAAFAAVNSAQRQRGELADAHPVHFLRTEKLNADLADYLAQFGHCASVLQQVRDHQRVLPEEAFEQRPQRDSQGYYDDALRAFVLQREALLFNRFPEYRREAA